MRIDRKVLGILGCILLLLEGCSGRTSQSSLPTSQPVPVSTPEASKEQRVPMIGKKEAAKKPSPPSPLTEEKPISLDPLFGVPTQKIYPRDFELGELKPLDSTAQDAARVAEEFFARVQRGSSLIELLHPDYRWFLEEDLRQWQGKSISFRGIRFGRVSESPSGVIEIPFRILQEERSVTGSILLENREAKWYVADFFLDWTELASKESTSHPAQKVTKEKEPFDPFKE